jgi:hypothetical protein
LAGDEYLSLARDERSLLRGWLLRLSRRRVLLLVSLLTTVRILLLARVPSISSLRVSTVLLLGVRVVGALLRVTLLLLLLLLLLSSGHEALRLARSELERAGVEASRRGWARHDVCIKLFVMIRLNDLHRVEPGHCFFNDA